MIVWLLGYGIISLFLGLAYVALMESYSFFWKKTPEYIVPTDFQPSTSISLLIPARNEAANIEACLASALAQNYPSSLLEIIVIDDHSDDQTAVKVTRIAAQYSNLRLLYLADYLNGAKHTAYKKKAIEVGIREAHGQLIVTTDADCQSGKDWLRSLVACYEQHQPKFIAAPVNFQQERNSIEYFQSLDFCGMMGITAAGIKGRFMHMCNGANLAYEKAAFFEVEGFLGIDNKASGDDMLLMQKMARAFPEQIAYVKSRAALVHTRAQPNWSSFLQQRLRWASKSTDYQEWKVTAMLAAVYLFCVNLFLVGMVGLFWEKTFLYLLVFLLGLKILVDYRLLSSTTAFFHRRDLMSHFLRSQLWHIFYIVSVGTLANLVKKYQWKGRSTS